MGNREQTAVERRWAAAAAWRVAVAAVAVVVGTGCSDGESQPATAQTGREVAGADRVIPVEVAVAELGSAARSITGTGIVEPIRTVAVNSQLSGALLAVLVEESDVVRRGQLLARVDSRELEAQLASAEAGLEVAGSAARRTTQLRDARIVTAAEFERDRAALAAAEATRAQLRARLGYATLQAPIAGVVLEKRVERGDIVAPQTPLFTIGDVSTLVVRVPVSELDVTEIREGDTARVMLDALPGRTLRGRVRRVFPAADSATRLVPVEVALSGATARDVRPGFLARVTFRLAPRENVLMIPGSAVVESANAPAVFVVREGRASRRAIRRGSSYEGQVEVLDGLAAGDTVVVAGNTTLRDGARVRVVTAPGTDRAPTTLPVGAAAGTPTASTVGTR